MNWKPLEQAVKEERLPRPEGSFTVEEYRQHFKVGYYTTYRRLRRLIAEGKVERVGHGASTYYIFKEDIL